MAGETALSDVNGWTRRIYGELKDARPGTNILQKKITFNGGTKKVGESYQVGVTLSYPNGWTYLGSTGTASSTLKQPRPMQAKQASITPFNSMLEERVAYTALLRIQGEGEGAYTEYATEAIKGMQKSGTNRIECNLLDGGRSLGTVEAVADGGSSTMVVTITAATWRPGLFWALGPGATFDSWTSSTKNNGTAALVLVRINAAERKLTFSHGGTYSSECAAGDVLFFEGATSDGGTTLYEATGLIAQARNLTGTSMGISASDHPNWSGNQKDVQGAMSFDVLEEAIGELRDRGVEGPLEFYAPNKMFAKLMSEPRASRSFDSSYSPDKAKQGHKSMSFYGKDVGEVEIINHNFLAQSEFLILKPADCCRVGSTDMTLGVPNTDTDYWFQIPGTPYAGIQLTIDQGPLLKMPSNAMHGYGVTYT